MNGGIEPMYSSTLLCQAHGEHLYAESRRLSTNAQKVKYKTRNTKHRTNFASGNMGLDFILHWFNIIFIQSIPDGLEERINPTKFQ